MQTTPPQDSVSFEPDNRQAGTSLTAASCGVGLWEPVQGTREHDDEASALAGGVACPLTAAAFYDPAFFYMVAQVYPLLAILLTRRSLSEYRERVVWMMMLQIATYQWMIKPPSIRPPGARG